MSSAIPTLVCFIALASALSQPAHATADIGGWGDDQMRSCVVALGDLDHDGLPDFALARRRLERPGFGKKLEPVTFDRVWLVSSRDGAAIRVLEPPRPMADFGHSLANAGDIDGDGCAELVVGGGRSLWVCSGRTGALLHELAPPLASSGFMGPIAAGHDLDCDGVPDIAGYLAPAGAVVLHSGRTGELLRVIAPRADANRWVELVGVQRCQSVDTDALRGAVTFYPDRDRDGRAELVLALRPIESRLSASASEPNIEQPSQSVAIVDAFDGECFLRFSLPASRRLRPWLLAALPDLDADELGEIALTMVNDSLSIHSGATGAELHLRTWHGGYLNGEGVSFDVLGDVNDDGIADYVLGANEDDIVDCDEGFALLGCGRTGVTLAVLQLTSADMREHGRPPGCGPGVDVCALGDFDGDGVPDALVAIPRLDQLRVLSGRGFAELRRYSMSSILNSASDAAVAPNITAEKAYSEPSKDD